MKKTKKASTPETGQSVLDAWALLSKLEDEGVDARGELEKHFGAPDIVYDPPTKVSAEGVPIISRERIQGLSPERVAEVFYHSVLDVADKRPSDWDESQKRLQKMPQHWRTVYTVFWLKCEVDNGGHEQFFSNGRGEFDDATEADLCFIGAREFLKIFREARRLYYGAPADLEDRIPGIEPMDKAFDRKKKNLFHLLGEYILTHLEDYGVPPGP